MQTSPKLAVVALIVAPGIRIVTIEQPGRYPIRPKFPGGKSDSSEDALLETSLCPPEAVYGMVARREVEEETGIVIPESTPFRVVCEKRENGHLWVLLHFNVPAVTIREGGEKGVKITLMSPRDILNSSNFLMRHKRAAENVLKELERLPL